MLQSVPVEMYNRSKSRSSFILQIGVILILVFFFQKARAEQNLDSLWRVWEDTELTDSTRVAALQKYAWKGFLYSKPDSAFKLAQLSYNYAESKGLTNLMGWALLGQGVTYKMRGNQVKAINYYLKSLELFERSNEINGIAGVLNNIGMMYYEQADYGKAIDYHKRSLEMRKKNNDILGVSGSYSNLGDVYKKLNEYDTALSYYQQSLEIKQDLGREASIAYSLNDMGQVYFERGQFEEALTYFVESYEMAKGINPEPINSTVHVNLGWSYLNLNNVNEALANCSAGLKIAEDINNLGEQLKACECIFEIHKQNGSSDQALVFYEKVQVLSDSLNQVETSKLLQSMEFDKKLLADSIQQVEKERIVQEQFDEEVRKKNRTRNIFLVFGVFALIAAIGLWSRLKYIRKAKSIIEKEKDRSENLLLNILPAEIAQELKEKGKADARDFEMVSILFTDFVGFTKTSEKLTAAELVEEINYCFEGFDSIIEKYKVEKIKTIGDAYMAAGGLPIPTDVSVKNTILAALEMQSFVTKRKEQNDKEGIPSFEMRVGIHTGPVVAGIVGVKKFQYDIWGDTVNTASRIESNSEPGRVNISQTTYDLLKDDPQFSFESRGMIDAKGKGEMEMYFIQKTNLN